MWLYLKQSIDRPVVDAAHHDVKIGSQIVIPPQLQQSHANPYNHHNPIIVILLSRTEFLVLQITFSLWSKDIDRRDNGHFHTTAIIRPAALQQTICVHLLFVTALTRLLALSHSSATGCGS
jgi:hypothetical protein